MNVAAPILVDRPAGVTVAHDPRGLDSFRDPGCAAAIWDREMPSDVVSWLAGLGADALPNGRVAVQADAVNLAVRHLCDIAEMPNGPQRDWLVDDVTNLARRFAGLMDAPYLCVRLQAIDTNACRKFHLDAITGRLVCTYRGTGTQYGIAARGEEPKQIFTVSTGAPVLLRGSLWPPEPAPGLLHRSPPIEGTGQTRLVLVLDPISEPPEAE